MDNNFQTSFIPKKPMTTDTSRAGSGINIFLVISIFVFIVAIMGSAYVYIIHNVLVAGIKTKVAALKVELQEPTTLENIIKFDRQLNFTNKILNSHISVSPIFAYLQENTAENVRFKSLTFSYTDPTKVSVKMTGIAQDFNTIAGQADAFRRSNNSGIINPIFSDFVPTLTGAVSFNLTSDLDQSLINYKAQKDKMAGSQSSGVNQVAAPGAASSNFDN